MPFKIAFSRKGMTFRTFTCETQTWWVQSYPWHPHHHPSKPPSVRPSTTRQRNFAPQRMINVMRAAPKIKESGHQGKWWKMHIWHMHISIYGHSVGKVQFFFSDGYRLIMSLPFRSTSSNHAHTTMYKIFWGVLPGFPGQPPCPATFDIMEQQHVQRGASRLIICQRETCRQICHVRKNLPFMNMRPYPTEKNKPSISSSKLSWEEGIEYFTTCLNWFCIWGCLRGVLR